MNCATENLRLNLNIRNHFLFTLKTVNICLFTMGIFVLYLCGRCVEEGDIYTFEKQYGFDCMSIYFT